MATRALSDRTKVEYKQAIVSGRSENSTGTYTSRIIYCTQGLDRTRSDKHGQMGIQTTVLVTEKLIEFWEYIWNKAEYIILQYYLYVLVRNQFYWNRVSICVNKITGTVLYSTSHPGPPQLERQINRHGHH